MRSVIAIISIFLSYVASYAFVPQSMMRFHCEKDTAVIDRLLQEAPKHDNPQNSVYHFASQLIDSPYKANTLEGDQEYLSINVHEFDCVTLVETAIALAKTSVAPSPSWRSFASNLESIRYRKGTMNGYSSRLHYMTDWIADNVYRGNIKELTQEIEGATTIVKSLNYMSRHAEQYKALSDSANLAEIKRVEMGYHSHRIPCLKPQHITKKSTINLLKDGDIIVILSKTDGLDASHLAIVHFVDGKPHIIHASTLHGKVTLENITLSDYLKRHARTAPGIRILRVRD